MNKIKLLSSVLAIALTATSVTPLMAAPVFAPQATTDSIINVQTGGNRSQQEFGTVDEDGVVLKPGQRVQRRDNNVQQRQENRNLQRRQIDRIPQGEQPRAERRGDDNRRLERRVERREDRRDDRRQARFERRGDGYYYNGRRGYRERRDGYRYYNGYWFPAAAFTLGVIIGNANNNRGGDWEEHVDWCFDRYGRNYRQRDNTYISPAGYRRECVSPFS